MKKIFFYFVSFCPILFFGQVTTDINLSTDGTIWKVVLVEDPSLTFSGIGRLSVSGCPQTPDPRLNCRIDVTHYKPALLERAKTYLNTPGNYGFLYFINAVLTPAERTLYFDYKTSTTLSYPDIVKTDIPLTYTITQGIVLFEVTKACTFAGNSTTGASYASLSLTCNNRYYYDGDDDGFGNPDLLKSAFFCKKPSKYYVTNVDDCDDSTSLIGKKKTWYIDHDGDGYGSASYYSAILPVGVSRTIESCLKPSPYLGYSYADNYTDNDDENASHTPSNVIVYYPDSDGDGYGFIQGPSISGYLAPKGYVANNLDCDDHDSYITAIFWGIDVNGDGVINDLDGSIKSQCTSPGAAYSLVNDPNNNWTHSVSYDVLGNITGIARTYFDDLGKSNVSLSKDFVQNRIWGSETLYDNFGRPDKTSFVAPSPLSTVEKVNFFKTPAEISASSLPNTLTVRDPVTTNTTVQAMDLVIGKSAISAGLTVNFNAKAIILKEGFSVTATAGSSFKATPIDFPDNSVQASLANYYSDNNTLEPYQATATQPYSQNNYDTLNPGNVINVVGGNKINGDWKTGYSYTVPATQEMYYVYGSDYYDGAITSKGEEVITKFYKSVSVDANGVENVAFTDGEGKVLATARSGTNASYTPYPVVSLIGAQGFVDVHIPAGISSSISLIGGASLYTVYNLKTGAVTTTLTGGNAYRVQAKTAPTTDPKVYISGGGPTYDVGVLGIVYAVNYYDYAVNVYNKTGQLIKSIQPNGYVANSTIVPVPAHMTSNNFATTYVYNSLGQVIQTTSPDEGTSKFAYRKDGQIRYSQSALQADTKVSYTNYDTYARPIESGVLTGATGIWDLANAGSDSSSLIVGAATENVFTVYDEAVTLNSDPNTLTSKFPIIKVNLTTVLTAAAIDPANYMQQNLSGNVAITYNKPNGKFIDAITWYSYDIYGRTEWIVQYNEGIGAKTIHYYYDYKGNVKSVYYQKDNKTGEFFAHLYSYDANDKLTQVRTATNLADIGTSAEDSFPIHANYTYYLTGELKRVKIAEGLQGLDYVYTLGGQLKSINHPSLEVAKDPGGDANDVFGLTLDYYNGDYLRTGRNITSSPSAGADYNGNIKAARWANKGVVADISGSNANQKGYLYNYDRNNWLTAATFGNTNSSTAAISPTAAYSEGNLSYDANGNIKTLQRTNDASTTVDNLTYNYTGKNQLNNVTDAVAASVATTDIDTQVAGNYTYDAIGQMTRNNQEDINYFYNTQGLVTQVNKGSNPVVKFFYNERGQRIKKESYNTSTFVLNSTDYYILDLSGNVMSIYNKSNGGAIVQKDLPIFGLSRLGVYNRASATSTYEITDHLGNVRAVVQKVSGSPVIKSFADYYPFGELLPNRNSLNYRYAFQGQELDGETGMEAFQLRLWDGRIGRWLSKDPKGQYASPYLGMGNNPINRIDPDGGDDWYLPKGETDQSKAVWIDGSGAHEGYTHLGGADFNFSGGWLNNVNIRGTPKSSYVSSGAYGWNDGSAERFWDHMPLTGGTNSIINGANSGNKSQMAWGVVALALDVFTLGEGSVGIKAAGGAVDAYALKAVESGFYPVMTRGFKKATELVYLEAGEVWKYGVTKNPLTRYTQKYLDNIGEFGVYYEPILAGARTEALQIEKMGILNYIEKHGFLPAGNKVKF